MGIKCIILVPTLWVMELCVPRAERGVIHCEGGDRVVEWLGRGG